MFKALKKFQEDRGLTATGTAKPGDVTEKALNEQASKTPEGSYIWRTVGDNRVRESHTILEGEIRSWKDEPDPGEEINCRCWAEPVSDENTKECHDLAVVLANERLQLEELHKCLSKAVVEFNAALKELEEAQKEWEKIQAMRTGESAIAFAGKGIFSIVSGAVTYFSYQEAADAAYERFKKAEENYEALKFEIEDLQRWIDETLKNIAKLEEEMEALGCDF